MVLLYLKTYLTIRLRSADIYQCIHNLILWGGEVSNDQEVTLWPLPGRPRRGVRGLLFRGAQFLGSPSWQQYAPLKNPFFEKNIDTFFIFFAPLPPGLVLFTIKIP